MSRRYAVTLTPDEVRRLSQKQDERRGAITDALIARHLAGEITLATPIAMDGRAHLLPLDIDAGGIAALHALTAESTQRSLWSFEQSCPRPGLTDPGQRGSVRLPFDQRTDKHRLQQLGAELIAAGQPEMRDCPLAGHGRNDAFNVYRISEGVDSKTALRRLNNPE
jgi:hypothetical protein